MRQSRGSNSVHFTHVDMVKKIKAASEWGKKGDWSGFGPWWTWPLVLGGRVGVSQPAELLGISHWHNHLRGLAQDGPKKRNMWQLRGEWCQGSEVRWGLTKSKRQTSKDKMKFFNKEFKVEIGEFCEFPSQTDGWDAKCRREQPSLTCLSLFTSQI